MRVHRVATTADDFALFVERRALRDIVRFRVQITHVLGDHNALGILPRSVTNSITRVDAGIATRQRRAEVSSPGSGSGTCCLGQCRAVSIGTFQSAEIRPVTLADAGYEKRYVCLLGLCLIKYASDRKCG